MADINLAASRQRSSPNAPVVSTPDQGYRGGGSVYPQGPWNDFPMLGGTPTYTGAPVATQPAGAREPQQPAPWWITKDYWAPDRTQVLNDPSRWGSDPTAPKPPTTPAPFDVNAFLQGWVTSGGRTNQDWSSYYGQHPEAHAAGYTLPTGTKNGELLGPNGTGWDTVYASGLGGQGAQMIPFGQGGGGAANPLQSSYAAQFSDPSTKRLEEYVNQLMAKLQQPPFSGQDQEVLRTQALEPIERDRTAAHQRALNNIGARGFDPSSGIAQELLNNVDRGFDTSRAQAQHQLAYNTIGQSHANDQQVLSLLQLLYQLPRNSMNDALAVLNGSPNYSNLFNSYAQMGMMNNANSAASGQSLGALLAYLLGGH